MCRKFSVDCVTSEEHKRDGDFAKGRLIEKGLAHIEGGGWVLGLDADIVLPTDFHQILDDAHLDPSCIHGCDRLNVTGEENWAKVKQAGLLCRENPWMIAVDRPNTTVGARVANIGHGFTPLGFFSLWHGSDSVWRNFPSKRYPTFHGNAARGDVMHSLHWDRRKRVFIPELIVWHLESEACEMGKNWKGRKTKPFGSLPQTPPSNSSY